MGGASPSGGAHARADVRVDAGEFGTDVAPAAKLEWSSRARLDQELSELRARAYGPHPDIQDDPEALGRLAELESAHRSEHAMEGPVELTPEVVDPVDAPVLGAVVVGGEPLRRPSLWQKLAATRSGLLWLILGSLVVVLGGLFMANWFAAPTPDATLRPSGVAADSRIVGAVSGAPLAEVDESTLRGYEAYRGLEPWVAESLHGSRCLLAIEGETLWGIKCAPPGVELMIDLAAWPIDSVASAEGLADGTVIRFRLRGDTVDAYLSPPPSAD